jgi:hypothetical protein
MEGADTGCPAVAVRPSDLVSPPGTVGSGDEAGTVSPAGDEAGVFESVGSDGPLCEGPAVQAAGLG